MDLVIKVTHVWKWSKLYREPFTACQENKYKEVRGLTTVPRELRKQTVMAPTKYMVVLRQTFRLDVICS